MISPAAFVVILALLAPGELDGQAVDTRARLSGEVAFDGKGTLGGFTGTSTKITGRLFEGIPLARSSGWVEADAASLKTGNNRRDRDMYSSLEVDKYPAIRFDLDSLELLGPAQRDSVPVTLRGRFTIHGISRAAAVRGWVVRAGQRPRFAGTSPMTLTDYRIGKLTKAMGLFRMNPAITVRMNITFEG